MFRSKPEIDVGFLHGGFWKYSAKPSNIIPVEEDVVEDESEGKHTIQDDLVVAGQDFAAGLVRMGILPRLRYLLEVKMIIVKTFLIVSLLLSAIIKQTKVSATCPRFMKENQTLLLSYKNRSSSGSLHVCLAHLSSIVKYLSETMR